MSFDVAINRLLTNEGGYVNNPKDPGGETNWGITIGFARANGYAGDMHAMTREQAIALYRAGFWNLIDGDELPDLLGFQVLDFAVNSGISTAIRKLQSAAGVADDGRFGPVSIAALKAIPPSVLTFRFLSLRLDFMRALSTWSTFGKGWAGRIAIDMRFAADDLVA